jgi:hypothetical protein
MEPSILKSTKKILGVAQDYTVFDQDIITYINMAFSTLNQLDLSHTDGYSVTGYDSEWNDYLPDGANLNAIKTYIFLKVRLLFDPPTTSFAIESLSRQLDEVEWRLTTLQPTV